MTDRGWLGRRDLALWLLVAALFTLAHLRQSLHDGRLSMPPTFDDVGFLRDGLERAHVVLEQGPVAFIRDGFSSPPHSPWSTYLATAAFLIFGEHEWAPASLNGLLILGVLMWLAYRGRSLSRGWLLVIGAALLTWPLLGQAIENFRPDIAGGLVTAVTALSIVREPWLRAKPRRHYLIGMGLALALLIKPTISPVMAVIVIAALTAATITDLLREPAARSLRIVMASWARCLGTGAALALPFLVLSARHLSSYVYRNTFGELKDVWSPRLTSSEQAFYYLNGAGGRMMLASWLYLWVVLGVAALIVALARRDQAVMARAPAVAAVLAVGYAVVTLPAHKNPFLGSVLPCLMLFIAIEWMVYLTRERAIAGGAAGWTVCGRWLLVLLLTVGISQFRWPYQRTDGGPLAPHEARQHRDLLETIYDDLRHVDGETTRVFFTQISAFLNPPLLDFRADQERLSGFVSGDLQLNDQAIFLEHEMRVADHVIAFSPDNRHAMEWLPGAETQASILERLRDDSTFVLAGIYGTPNTGEVYLFTRAVGFRGIRPLAGLGPLEGAYPHWNLHTKVRWAMGPVTRLEARLPRAARVRVIYEARADFPDQSMGFRVSGREVHRHSFAAPSVFEHAEFQIDLAAGRHVLEIEHSHWHAPSDSDDRPRAVLLRTFTVLPYFDADTIIDLIVDAE